MKLKLAKRMLKAREGAYNRARAHLAQVDRELRDKEEQLELARSNLRALHANPELRSTELERAHSLCKELERDLQVFKSQRQQAQEELLARYNQKECATRVLDNTTHAIESEELRQEQRCNDDRSTEHLKKLA